MSEISVVAESAFAEPQTEPISQLVIEAVADAEGLDPLDLRVPLYDVVDPDALDSLFGSGDDGAVEGHIEFTYYGYEVTVTSSGIVSLDETDD